MDSSGHDASRVEYCRRQIVIELAKYDGLEMHPIYRSSAIGAVREKSRLIGMRSGFEFTNGPYLIVTALKSPPFLRQLQVRARRTPIYFFV